MSYMNDILLDRDRRMKAYVDGVAVSASTLQSIYSRFPNFINHFTVVENTIGSLKTYDISLKYPGKIFVKEGNTLQGSVPRIPNFNDNHFDVTENNGTDTYDIDSTGWVKVNSFTVKPLNIINATNNEAVTAAEVSNQINLTFNNDETNVYSNGTLITSAAPRAPNFIGFTVTDDAANDRVNITGDFLPSPFSKKYGLMYGPQNLTSIDGFPAGDGLFNIPYTEIGAGNSISGGYDSTHGVFRRFITGGDDNDAIKIMSNAEITNRAANPHLYGKMRINTLNDHRFFVGFHTGTIPDNDDNFLDNLQGFGLGEQSDFAATPNTHFQIIRNDGDATADKASSGIAIAAGTVFTFELFGDNTNSRWSWNVNGGSFTNYTTEVPTTTNQQFTFQLEQIAGDESEFDIFYLYLLQDK